MNEQFPRADNYQELIPVGGLESGSPANTCLDYLGHANLFMMMMIVIVRVSVRVAALLL